MYEAPPTPSNPTGVPWPRVWCAVDTAQLHERRAVHPNASPGAMVRWWTITLECGHTDRRDAVYRRRAPDTPAGTARTRAELKDPPRRVRCGICETSAHRDAIRVAVAGTSRDGIVP